MKVVRDVVVRASGDGWNYKLARMLVDAEGNAAVFVPPGNEPAKLFTVDPKQTRAMKGTGVDADGGKVLWSQRASGCGYKLAKCNVKTATLEARWQKALDREAESDDQLNEQIDRVHGPGAAAALDEAIADGSVFAEGQRLASERDDLIAAGADSADLEVPLHPDDVAAES